MSPRERLVARVCEQCDSGKLSLFILQAARFLFKLGIKTYINASNKVTFSEKAA